MAQKYNTGDVAYIVESNRFLREVVVTKYVGGSYIIRFKDTGGGIRVHESRLFQTEEETEKRLGTDGKLGYEWLEKLPEIVGCDRVYLLLEENGMQAKYWIAECNPKVIN